MSNMSNMNKVLKVNVESNGFRVALGRRLARGACADAD